ncbi:MAG: GspH/FimT family pseudopilin [Phycisphaerae bacterium]
MTTSATGILTPPSRSADGFRRGFTLIEVVLAIGVLLLLGSIVVLSYTGMLVSGRLDEGTSQFEAALRMARAEAANQGRKFRLEFDAESGQCKATWEASPLTDPGVFIDYVGAAWSRGLPNDLVTVTRSDLTGASAYNVLPDSAPLSSTDAPALAAVTFYPDGSSDSAVFELRGRDASEQRTAIITLDGLSGTIDIQIYTPEEYQAYRDQLTSGT